METKQKTSPKDFFLHLGALVTMYISIWAILSLLFEVINYSFPDAVAMYSDPYSTAMRLAIASLIIIFPIFVTLSWLIVKDIKLSPDKKDLGIKKWLGYFTLFIAGLAVTIDLIVLLNTFLNGEITTRFVLKVLSVLVVAGAVFFYYIYDIRKGWEENKKGLQMFASISAILVLGSVVWGFVVMGSPTTARNMRFDDRRTSDLQTIQWQVVNYWQLKNALPKTLSDLNDPISNFVVPTDPETNSPYSYKTTGTLAFNICANFSLKSASNVNNRYAKPYPVSEISGNENWNHGVGETCFDRTIDPKLYPPRVK